MRVKLSGPARFLPAFSLLFSVLTTLLLSCSRVSPLPPPDPLAVMALTSGSISPRTPIRVVFNEPQDTGFPLAPDVFRIRDAGFGAYHKGSVFWEDRWTLGFIPSAPLRAEARYVAFVDMGKTGAGIPPFSFDFTVEPPSLKVDLAPVQIDGNGDALVTGTLELSGGAGGENVEKLISAPGLGRVSWVHQGNIHRFSFPPQKREIEARSVEISWSGKSVGSKDRGSAELILPGLGRFEVLEIREKGGSVIEIVFSKPLKPDQDLRGFVSLSTSPENSPNDIRYTVEGNVVKVYSGNGIIPGSSVLSVRELSGEDGTVLHQPVQYTVPEKWDLPELRFTGKGVILPTTQGSTMAVETRNLSGLLIEAFAIYGDKMLQFLQVNRLEEQRELERVGETIWAKEFTFDWKPSDKNRWIQRGLDLSSLAEKNPGGMFYIRMSFRRRHIKYEAGSSAADVSGLLFPPDQFEPIIPGESRAESSAWDSYNEYSGASSRYDDRFNPNHPAFYEKFYNHNITVGRNVLVSDLGLLAKRGGDGAWLVSANNVRTTRGAAGIPVRLISYQGRVLAEGKTDPAGLAAFGPVKDAYFAYAESGADRAYLKLNESLAMATSHFEVGGGLPVSGIRGLIYGERGVWRPGDTLYLTFLLSDPKNTLPPDHPVSFDLEDPKGQIFKSAVYTKSTDGFYPLTVDTPDTAPTGDWTARVRVGGNTFTKTLKIETVMPNRLKMELDFGAKTYLDSAPAGAALEAAWLYGASAPGLKADVSVTFSDRETSFPAYGDYGFRDPSRTVSGERTIIYQGSLDGDGRAAVDVKLKPGRSVPGLLNAHFLVRVFENSGVFSSQQFTMDYSPYERYVGLKLPPGDAARNMLLTDTDHRADIVILDGDGKPVPGRTDLEAAVYKLSWRWWWEKGAEDRAEFASAMSRRAIARETISARDGKASWNFRIAYPDWGRYLVVVQDREGGHSTARVVYIDWPGWAGRAQDGAQGAQAMLTLSPEKSGYRVGEKIALSFPSNKDAAALVSVEKAGRIVSREWVKCSAERTRYELNAEPWMMPNIYVHVTLLQPHLQANNDLPLRLYGIIPVPVEDPATRLNPLILTADKWEAGSKASFTVREEAGRPMTYTAVVVDEGLLGLTRYRQPLPHDTFYTKEASFVKTWDLYSDFMGAYSGELETLLAIGGSDAAFNDSIKDSKRFKPVVRYFEPFTLKAGESRLEEFELPPYAGALRIMVLAAGSGTGGLRPYGVGEKTVTVASDLMVFPSLPRLLSPGDEALIPVTVASYAEGSREVRVSFSVRGAGTVPGGRSARIVPGESAFSAAPEQRISFDKPGEKTVNFRVKAGLPGKLEISAAASSPGLRDTVSLTVLEVRSTALPLTNTAAKLLNPGESWDAEIEFPGEPGTNTAKAEFSRFSPLGLESRLDSLISYPHGCVEQTTSAVFPQLYLDQVMELDPERLAGIRRNVNAGIQRLARFQTNSGGFSYWPGDSAAHSWGTSYAGHFLLEAQKAGYTVPFSLDKWVEFQRNRANAYSGNDSGTGALEQAYRLYTLALAGKADPGSMNRLREQRNLEGRARWQLAAAYWYAGQRDAARTMVRDLSVESEPYRELGGTFGSDLRDRAVILETLALMDSGGRVPSLFQSVSETLSSEQWLSTQETAYALIAASRVLRDAGKAPLSVDLVFNGRRSSLSFESPLSVLDLGPADEAGPGGARDGPESAGGGAGIRFENSSPSPVYIRAAVRGTPAEGSEPELSQGLALSVEYRDMNGAPVDPDKLPLGEDMEIRVTLKNTDPGRALQELALVHPLPANYEIINTRLGGSGGGLKYQDIRDDRVLSYFDLARGASKTLSFTVNRVYEGSFYRPAIRAYAMYDESICALIPGKR